MKALLCFCLIFALLAANIEGAGDVPIFADIGSGALDQAPGGGTASSRADSGGVDTCAFCTPSCHCGLHAAAVVPAVSGDIPPIPAAATASFEASYASLSEPPSLPPPIL